MRNTFLYIIIALLLASCTNEDEPSFLGKISGFIIYAETGEQKAVYSFAYDDEGRLTDKSSPLGEERIIYDETSISQWVYVQGEGTKTENFEYVGGKLDKINIDYEFPLSGVDLVEYAYEVEQCVQKTELLDGSIVNVYHYLYDNNGLMEEVQVERKVQDDTLVYVYAYDNSGHVSEISLNGNAYTKYQYTTFDNPLYDVSKATLLNIPVDPDFPEKAPLTAKFLLSEETYFSGLGTIDQEISYTYTLNDKGKPGVAERIFNDDKEEIIYTYY